MVARRRLQKLEERATAGSRTCSTRRVPSRSPTSSKSTATLTNPCEFTPYPKSRRHRIHRCPGRFLWKLRGWRKRVLASAIHHPIRASPSGSGAVRYIAAARPLWRYRAAGGRRGRACFGGGSDDDRVQRGRAAPRPTPAQRCPTCLSPLGVDEVAISRRGRVAWTSEDRAGLWVMDRSRKRVRRLKADASLPEWSPDGRRLAYKDSQGRVRIIRPDGKRRRLVTRRCIDFQVETDIAWSPDGRRIACTTPSGNLITVPVGAGRVRTLLSLGDITRTPRRSTFARELT